MTDTSTSFAPAPPAASPTPSRQNEASTRQLIVGREISLSGEITACDRLVVEGSVEANLANCRDIDIAESGLFKGSASIEEAEIRGRFDGELTVRKRLLIRSTGKVVGTIRYGQIEIECGGQISGDIQSVAMTDEIGHPVETIRPVLGDRAPLERSDLHPARVN
ncbi:MAG TPA: polymer-forming cytoskeletal protein [Stellaceae bacterium]|nr:polymer-forming cytoskeletal protein [Stellaceae bacterium]